MLYTIPDYYHEFTCTAGACEDTCCAGWQIVVDEESLGKYKKVSGMFGERIKRSVNWKEETFEQDKNKRCAFLNEENLCDMYTVLGEESLCRTCRMYPRHVEEFEDVREVTLSVSCPEVARILMNKKEPVHFLTYEDEKEEYDDDFDPFLYSKLADARQVMIDLLQDRKKNLKLRVCLVLAIAYDLQECIEDEDIFSIDEVLDNDQTEESIHLMEMKLAEGEDYEFIKRMFLNQYQLEHLKEDWEQQLLDAEQVLYGNRNEKDSKEQSKNREHYLEKREEFHVWLKREMPEYEIQYEQLLVYFISTYFCGAVYDGEAYAKVQMAVVSTLLIHELLMARWLENGKALNSKDVIDTVYCYSRELEHSDQNLDLLEKLMKSADEVECD